jgi:hypothetical protein
VQEGATRATERLVGAALLGASLLAFPSRAALAQPADDGLSTIDLTPILRALDAPDLADRERAVEALVMSSAVSLREVLGLLSEVTALTPEQRARLVGIAREMFVQSPRAAMGVQFGGTVEKGVAIQSAVDGFDSARVIKPGDVIVAVNGEEVTQSRMRAIILSHDPGESMTLRLRRMGESGAEEHIDARVTLGSMNRLRGGGFIDASTMMDAWRERLLRAGVTEGPTEPPLEARIDHAAWLASAQETARSGVRSGGIETGPGTARAPMVVMAGESRAVWLEPGQSRDTLVDAEVLDPQRIDRRVLERMALREELSELQRELEALRSAIRMNAAAMQSPDLTDLQRSRLTVENQRLAGECGVVEVRVNELRGRLNRQQ